MQNISAVPRLVDVNELANLWRVSPHTIRAWVQQKRLKPTKICRRLLFHPDECARFLAGGNSDPKRQFSGGG
jgi:DNA-binding transcriptional MerR regulator